MSLPTCQVRCKCCTSSHMKMDNIVRKIDTCHANISNFNEHKSVMILIGKDHITKLSDIAVNTTFLEGRFY